MHIQYQTKLQAQKALSKNGKILSNSLMVGVMPCLDKVILDFLIYKKNDVLSSLNL